MCNGINFTVHKCSHPNCVSAGSFCKFQRGSRFKPCSREIQVVITSLSFGKQHIIRWGHLHSIHCLCMMLMLVWPSAERIKKIYFFFNLHSGLTPNTTHLICQRVGSLISAMCHRVLGQDTQLSTLPHPNVYEYFGWLDGMFGANCQPLLCHSAPRQP